MYLCACPIGTQCWKQDGEKTNTIGQDSVNLGDQMCSRRSNEVQAIVLVPGDQFKIQRKSRSSPGSMSNPGAQKESKRPEQDKA